MQLEMMEDGRPSSLPENDCTASNARRIEKRPANALRPSSERLGRITLKRKTLAITGKVDIREDPFRNISDEILELILARLPRLPLKAAKKVCKRWASVTSTPEFDILRKKIIPKSFLIRFCISSEGRSIFTYDVETDALVTVPGLQSLVQSHDSLDGASGVVFAIAGTHWDRLLYKLTSFASSVESFGEKWYETPAMRFPRWKPLVSVTLGIGMGHKVVVAGGGVSQRVRHKAVEVFDSEIGTWESYGDLPKEFSFSACYWSMSGVVLDNKFYVLPLNCEIGELKIHFLDFSTREWASVELEPPMELIHKFSIMAIGPTLVVAGFFEDKVEEQYALKLWKVDLNTLRLTQVGLMPRKLVPSFVRFEPFFFRRVSCLVHENLVCVRVNGWLCIVAEVFLEECKTYWCHLPGVPDLNPGVDYCSPFWASISCA